jgi:aminopeptidase N
MTDFITPLHYIIHLEPDLEQFTFEGMVTLEIHASFPVREVVLHARDLEFQHCILLGNEQECDFSINTTYQEATIHLPVLVESEFALRIEYTGIINNQYAGLYRSKYTHNGLEKILASTQLEAKDARRVFPCFDQPGKKATFDIEYVIPAGLMGISNTEIVEEKLLGDGRKLVQFARTPKMSTYLVFFGIGEFEFVEDDSEKPLVRVVVTPGKTNYSQFALDMARKTLRFGVDYTGVAFPLSKCDYIAVPDSMGAMENFGAIRHCEDDLLVYPESTSKARKVLTAKIIAHEGIHQWFGDLVSPAAWAYLWLNEAFATYFTYVIPDHFHPEWGVWQQYFQERLLTGMERDSLLGTVPIELFEISDPDADPTPTPSTKPIVYDKGAAVLRMLATHLGEDRFKQALHDYLMQYKFGAPTSKQFWETVSRSTGLSLDKFTESWIYQPGYPLVDVERNERILKLTQTRFSFNPKPVSSSTWVIPIDILCFLADGSTHFLSVLLDQPSQIIELPENITACKLNADFTGFYRVCYQQDVLEQLGELIRSRTLTATDSLNIINDLFALVKAGKYPVDDYLRFVETYFIEEDRYLPLTDLTKSLSHLYRVISPRRAEISRLGNAIFERALNSIGYLPAENEELLATELRTTLLTTTFLLGSDTISDFGKTQFQAMLNGKDVHRDILPAVLKIGAGAHPKAAGWLKARAMDSRLSEGERVRALEALGNLNQTRALEDALSINLQKIPSSLRHHLLGEVAFNPFPMDWMWDWFEKNLTNIEELPLPYVQTIIVRMIPLCGIGHEQAVNVRLREFISRHASTEDSIVMALELLTINERLRGH